MGELDATVVTSGRGELGRLGRPSTPWRDRWSSHATSWASNTELEMQAIELEERQGELSASSDELRAAGRTVGDGGATREDTKRRAEVSASFADSLATERETDVTGVDRAVRARRGGRGGIRSRVLYLGAPGGTRGRWARAAAVGLRSRLAAGAHRGRVERGSAARRR